MFKEYEQNKGVSTRLIERNKNEKPAERKNVDTSNLIELYNSGMPIKEIAVKAGMTYNGVKSRLIRSGIILKK